MPPLPEAKEATRNWARYDAPPKPRPSNSARANTGAGGVRRSQRAAESLIAADITIEGKIEGGGSVRIAGNFKGDENVQGDLTLESVSDR